MYKLSPPRHQHICAFIYLVTLPISPCCLKMWDVIEDCYMFCSLKGFVWGVQHSVRNVSMWFLTNAACDHTCLSFPWLVHIYFRTYVYIHWTVSSSPTWKGHHGACGTDMLVAHVHVHGTVLSCPFPCGEGQGRCGHVISMWQYMCISIFLSRPV